MPTSAARQRQSSSQPNWHALWYGRGKGPEDAALHEPIMGAGDDDRVVAIGREVARKLGLSEQDCDALYGPARGKADRTPVQSRAGRGYPEYDPSEDRDPSTGEWSGGGDGDGGGKHPGEGYSKHAVEDKHGVIHTSDVNDAVKALSENREVELKQPKQISTLIHRLGAIARQMHRNHKSIPTFNLCKVSIAGTNLFCAETKGIPRVKMPQLDKQQTKDFMKYLKDKGYDVSKEKERADHLRATQDELNGAKVAANMDKLKDEPRHQSRRLVISKDDYILDGHHHWAAKIGLDAADNDLKDDAKMKVYRVDIPIIKLLKEAEKFTGGKGHKPASESKADCGCGTVERSGFDPSQPRDLEGKWTSGGASGSRALELRKVLHDQLTEEQKDQSSSSHSDTGGIHDAGTVGMKVENLSHTEGVELLTKAGFKKEYTNADPKAIMTRLSHPHASAHVTTHYPPEKHAVTTIAVHLKPKPVDAPVPVAQPVQVPEVKDEDLDPKVIEVGGDAWNKATAKRLEREYQQAKPQLEAIVEAGTGTPSVEMPEEDEPQEAPDEWDAMSSDEQDEAEKEYISKNYDSIYDSEVQNWYSEHQEDEARELVINDFNEGGSNEYMNEQWVYDGLNDLRTKREEEGEAPIPFTNEQLIKAMKLDYKTGYYPKKDLEIEFDDSKLTNPIGYDPNQLTLPGVQPIEPAHMLTEEMRKAITFHLGGDFEDRVDEVVKTMNPPDYLQDSAKELTGEMWDQLDDEQKFDFVKSQTDILKKYEPEESDTTPHADWSTSPGELPTKYDPLNITSGTNYHRTQRLAKYLSIQRAMQLLKQRGLPVPSVKRMASIDNDLWSGWVGSSTTREGKLLQMATADELGGRLNTASRGKDTIVPNEVKDYASIYYSDIGSYEGVKAYVRAKWETTQYLLDKAGMKDLELYRGIRMPSEDITKLLAWLARHAPHAVQHGTFKQMPTLEVVRNGAASSSISRTVANNWVKHNPQGIVLRAHIPRTAAISVPAYGQNSHSEQEVVIAGTAWKGWDAWHGDAPDFEDKPLQHKPQAMAQAA